MVMVPIVIWGASGHALVIADILRLTKKYKIFGFLDDVNSHLYESNFCGSTILGGREQLSDLRKQCIDHIVIAIGDCHLRQQLSIYAQSQGFKLITIIHPSAVISKQVTIGDGTVICAASVVNPGTDIGENVIINTASTVDHECTIEDAVHIGPGVHMGGRARVKKRAWVGIGAVISDRITIGENSIIGAGAVVVRDIPPNVVAYGVPAKVVRNID
jgi:acetyltransferase EpsM